MVDPELAGEVRCTRLVLRLGALHFEELITLKMLCYYTLYKKHLPTIINHTTTMSLQSLVSLSLQSLCCSSLYCLYCHSSLFSHSSLYYQSVCILSLMSLSLPLYCYCSLCCYSRVYSHLTLKLLCYHSAICCKLSICLLL